MLQHLGVSTNSDYDILALRREIERLSEDVKSVNINRVVYGNGKENISVVVPQTKTHSTFKQQLKRTHWL